MRYPVMYRARYALPAPYIENVHEEVKKVFKKARFWKKLKKGARVAVTAGSRGISDIVPVLMTTLEILKENHLQPYLVPAMGSHGGGTPEGQKKVLAALGITEETTGVPIKATGEAAKLGEIAPEVPVYFNKAALESDGIIVVNRVKPHTSFHGPVESGLMKMLAIGLGNPQGAAALHRFGPRGLKEYIPLVAQFILANLPVLYGIAIIENAREQTAHIEGVEPEDFFHKEQQLLNQARSLMPRLPFQELDLLIVREMGKCFSGTGMDTNLIGRLRIQGEPEPETPRIKRIAVLDLAARSEGNATGIGLADFATDRLLSKVDWEVTYLNVLSTTFVQRAMVPMHFPTEEETIQMALRSLGSENPHKARVLVIQNTLELDEVEFSAALIEEAKAHPCLTIISEGREMAFNNGTLL
ncbi:MAG: lactate racemase domain-containing protein [Bacillota bacterium]|nr:lactate racemase domain-containing protein [Bacillota bacterium]